MKELGNGGSAWQLLVRIEPRGINPDARATAEGWEATAHQRFERLLRETGIFAGVLVSEKTERREAEDCYVPELRLVYAPRGETSGHLNFPLGALGTVVSHIAGTIFENTNKPLRDWFKVAHLMLTSKKVMSALQIMRYMGFGSYKTAWGMCHKIRVALMEDIEQLGGIVEVDETFVGGLAKNKHIDKRGKGGGTGGIASGKTPIVSAVKRKGNVIARVVNNVRADTLCEFVREAVSHKVSLLCTDQWVGYKHLDKEYTHAVIDHAKGQYVIGAVHTQTIEGFVWRQQIGWSSVVRVNLQCKWPHNLRTTDRSRKSFALSKRSGCSC